MASSNTLYTVGYIKVALCIGNKRLCQNIRQNVDILFSAVIFSSTTNHFVHRLRIARNQGGAVSVNYLAISFFGRNLDNCERRR